MNPIKWLITAARNHFKNQAVPQLREDILGTLKTDFLSGRLVTYWRKESLQIEPGVTTSEISTFQDRYKVVLPPSVRLYFETVNGTGDDMVGELLYRFWPLCELKPVEEELSGVDGFTYSDRFSYPQCFVFADHCMNCWLYAVKLTSDPNQPAPVFRVTASDPPGEQMASSFSEFMEQYLADPRNIL